MVFTSIVLLYIEQSLADGRKAMVEFWRDGMELGNSRIATFPEKPKIIVGSDQLFPVSIMGRARFSGGEIPVHMVGRGYAPDNDARLLAGQKILFDGMAEYGGVLYIDPRSSEDAFKTLMPNQKPDHNGAFKIPKGEDGLEAIVRSAVVQAIQGSASALLERRAAEVAIDFTKRDAEERIRAYGLMAGIPDHQDAVRGALRFATETIMRNPPSFSEGVRDDVEEAALGLAKMLRAAKLVPTLPLTTREQLFRKLYTKDGLLNFWGAVMGVMGRQDSQEKRFHIVSQQDSIKPKSGVA